MLSRRYNLINEMTKIEILDGWGDGWSLREESNLCELDYGVDTVTIHVSPSVKSFTGCFVDGFIGESMVKLGEVEFNKRYVFVALEDQLADLTVHINALWLRIKSSNAYRIHTVDENTHTLFLQIRDDSGKIIGEKSLKDYETRMGALGSFSGYVLGNVLNEIHEEHYRTRKQ